MDEVWHHDLGVGLRRAEGGVRPLKQHGDPRVAGWRVAGAIGSESAHNENQKVNQINHEAILSIEEG